MIKTHSIPSSKLSKNTAHVNGNTQDIINSILKMDKKEAGNFCKFAQQFANGEKGLQALHEFVRNNVKYKADSGKQQIIKAPAALWRMRVGDCKSMTLFINKVLQCLGIPYLIRFTTYHARDKEVKHVYTVALLNGKAIPIDAVYHTYGKEKRFYKKIDYTPDMTEIIEITGLNFNQASKQNTNTNLTCPATPMAPTVYTNAAIEHSADVKQKQKDVERIEPPKFHKITEGQAMLELSLQELHTMKAMQPEMAETAQNGINRVMAALKGDTLSALSGVIPCELYGLAEKIKLAPNLTMGANSHGYNARRLEQLLQETQEDGQIWTEAQEQAFKASKGIGQIQWPSRVCLDALWFIEGTPYAYTEMIGLEGWDYPNNPGRCGGIDIRAISQYPSGGPIDPEKIFYNYGKMSEYRVNAKEFGADYADSILAMDGDLLGGIGGNGGGLSSVWVSNGLNWQAIQDVLGQNSGATTKYINDIYNPTNPDGTMGSGLFYTFANGVTTPNGTPVNQNQLPNTVTTKKAFQDQFNDSVNIFTGVSPGNIKAMARNGVIFDSGKQPEATLNELYSLYITPTDAINGYKYIAGIGYVPVAEIIAAIAVAIVTIVAALAEAGVFAGKAQTQAPLLDDSASDNAQWRPLSPSTMAGGTDWEGGGGTGGGGAGKLTDNKALLIGGAVLLAYAATKDKKKK